MVHTSSPRGWGLRVPSTTSGLADTEVSALRELLT